MLKLISFFNKFEDIDIKNFTTIQYALPDDITSSTLNDLINTMLVNLYQEEINNIFNNDIPIVNHRFDFEDFKLSINWLQNDTLSLAKAYESLAYTEAQKTILIKSYINKYKKLLKQIERDIEIIKTKQLQFINIDNISIFDYSNIFNDFNKIIINDPKSMDILTNNAYVNEIDNTIETSIIKVDEIDFTYLNTIDNETTPSLINTIDVSKINNGGMNSYIYTQYPIENGAVLTLNLEFRNKIEINNINIKINPKYQYSKIELYYADKTTNIRTLLYSDVNLIDNDVYSIYFESIETNNLIIKFYQTACDMINENDLYDTDEIDRDEIEYAVTNNIKSIMLNKIQETEDNVLYAYNFNIEEIKISNSQHSDYSIVMFEPVTLESLKSISIIPNYYTDIYQSIEYYIYKIDYNEFGNIIRSNVYPLLPYVQHQVINERIFLVYDPLYEAHPNEFFDIGKLSFRISNPDTTFVYENNILLNSDEYEILDNQYIKILNPKYGAIYTVTYTPQNISMQFPSDKYYPDANDQSYYYDNMNTIYFSKELLSDEIYRSEIYLFAILRNNNPFNFKSPKIYNIKMASTHWS